MTLITSNDFLLLNSLNNLFNGLDEASPLRYVVYTAVIKLASQSDMLHLVNPKLEDIRNWLVQWDVGIIKAQALLRVLYDALVQCKQRSIISINFYQLLDVSHKGALLKHLCFQRINSRFVKDFSVFPCCRFMVADWPAHSTATLQLKFLNPSFNEISMIRF